MPLLAICAGMLIGLQAPDFQREIRPLLSDRCFTCHGPDEAARKLDLRLDTAEGAYADLGGYAAIVPGRPEASEMIARMRAEEAFDRMPPARSGLSLSEEEIDLLERWIASGAPYSQHWAFEAPRATPPPSVQDATWPRDPLDHFILARLESRGLAPNARAEAHTWLRRASFALTGLPPTPSEIESFLTDPSEAARERVVDRLLASPHFGEHMASTWLDLARYADTYGYQSDVERRVWPYRDWVIRAYNENLPYDEFLTWQLAGDLLPQATTDQRIATAFNRLHRQTNEGGSIEEEYRVEYVGDRVHTAGMAFMGLTLECARCHDHKFDPIRQREYYQLTAYFDDIDESGLYSHFTNATPTPAMDLPTREQSDALRQAEAELRRAEMAVSAARRAGRSPKELAEAMLREASSFGLHRPSAHFSFDQRTETGFRDLLDPERHAAAPEAVRSVDGVLGRAIELPGDVGLRLPGAGAYRRSDPFSVAFYLKLAQHHERAVVLHRSRAWTDAASQGWQLLIEEGRMTAALVHFWPGDAIAIRTRDPLPVNEWLHIIFGYDGSSRADGIDLWIEGRPVPFEVIRDRLTRSITGGGPGDPTIGERFRDRGLADGQIDELSFFDYPITRRPAHVSSQLQAALEQLRSARRKRDEYRDAIPQLMVMQEQAGLHPTWLLERGHYEARVEEVDPGVPAVLAEAMPAVPIPKNRLELARWLLQEEHPLTARLEIDRLWRAVFGRGLIPTPENLGSQGSPPTHPELLDALAREFQASGWDRKALLKRLVLSASFAQASSCDMDRRAQDPENHLWSRGPSWRLSAEMMRDAALATSGLLVRKLGGPSVKPYQPAGLWKEKSGQSYQTSQGEGLYRRSLYTFWKRTSPPPAMMIFDAAKRDVCIARRQLTNTPLQALVLWNDPQFGEAARVLAEKLLRENRARLEAAPRPESDRRTLAALFLQLAGRPIENEELQILEELLTDQRASYAAQPELAEAFRATGSAQVPADLDPIEHAAWTVVCSTLLASDPVVMLR